MSASSVSVSDSPIHPPTQALHIDKQLDKADREGLPAGKLKALHADAVRLYGGRLAEERQEHRRATKATQKAERQFGFESRGMDIGGAIGAW